MQDLVKEKGMQSLDDILLPNGVLLKPIPVSPNDDYMAGSDGYVYSRTKYASPNGEKGYVEWYPLSGCNGETGNYKMITLCHKGRKVTKSVHKLICMAFHGVQPFPYAQVRHLDGDYFNNLPENLQWGTQEENWMDRKAHGHGMEGEKHPLAKLTNFEMRALKWAIEKDLVSQHRAARILGMSQGGISAIVNRNIPREIT